MILVRFSGIDEICASGGIFKYVRMADGSFRFADIHGLPEHWQMVDSGEVAVSAGTVRVDTKAKEISTLTYGSSTLGIARPLDDDVQKIEALLCGQKE